MITNLLKVIFIYSGLWSLFRLLQRVRKGPGISILYGHRVLPDEIIADKNDSRTVTGQTCVSEVLAAVVELKKHFQIISIEQAVEQLKSGNIEKDSVVLTFDDGFQDNFTYLYPLLKKHNIPATYYVNSSVLSTNKSLWFQSIINYFYAIPEQSIHITINNKTYPLTNSEQRYAAAFDFMRYLQSNHKPQEFHAIIEQVAGDLSLPQGDDLHMTWDEVKKLADDPLITIGAHSYNHFPLGFCDEALSTEEITRSIVDLEQQLGQKIKHFSYPRGHVEDFNQHHIDCLKANQIESAVSTIRGVNRLGEDLYSLRRVGFPQCITSNKADFLWHVGGIPQLFQAIKGSR